MLDVLIFQKSVVTVIWKPVETHRRPRLGSTGERRNQPAGAVRRLERRFGTTQETTQPCVAWSVVLERRRKRRSRASLGASFWNDAGNDARVGYGGIYKDLPCT